MNRTTSNAILAGGLVLLSLPLFGAQDTPAPAPGNVSPPAAAAKATYVGSAACKACHTKVCDAWTDSAHGKYLDQDGLPAELKGCEACHGPASVHVNSGGATKPRVPKAADAKSANAVCGACHFQSETSKAPAAWQNMTGGYFVRSAHGRKGLACVSCHTGHANGIGKQLVKPGPLLCLTCHGAVLESSPGKKAAYIHAPVAQGQCMTCHDPHGSPSRDSVIPNVEKTCLTCHDVKDPKIVTAHQGYPIEGSKCAQCHDPHSHDRKALLVRPNQHVPFKSGNCAVCHTAPVAGQPVGLVKPVKELCATCHPSSKLMPEGEHTHVPAAEGLCTTCHNPHVSSEKALMKSKPAYACFACHAKIEDATVSEYRHQVLEANLDCMICHKPHSSPVEHLQVKEEMSLCGPCHKHSMSHPMGKRPDGSTVVNPLTGTPLICSSCHDIHGSKFPAHTKADKNKELCIMCHGKVEH